jgi:ribosomal protein S18 acetylase RimI-like enzyme
MKVSYRLASAADASVIAALGSTVWITTYATEGVPSAFAEYVLEHFATHAVRSAIAEPDARFWLAEIDRALVGFSELRLGRKSGIVGDPAQAEVARLYVLERFTRQGIGQTLLRHCASEAQENGISKLWLSVYSRNPRALQFYRQNHWRQVGDTVFALGSESYLNHVFAKAASGHEGDTTSLEWETSAGTAERTPTTRAPADR